MTQRARSTKARDTTAGPLYSGNGVPKLNIDVDLLQAALVGLTVQRNSVDRKMAEIRRMIRGGKSVPLVRSGVRRRRSRRAANGNIAAASVVSASRPKRNKHVAAAPRAVASQDEALSREPSRRRVDHNNSNVTTAFQNKAGEYELIRVADGQVHYSFKNRQGKTVDSVMPLILWQKIAARATQG